MKVLGVVSNRQKPSPTALGRNLQAARNRIEVEGRSVSQAKLAEMVGVHRQTIAQIESGTTFNPTLELLQKLAGALGCTVADLVSEVPTLPSKN